MNQVAIVQEAVAGTWLAYLPIQDANLRQIDVDNHSPLELPMMHQKSVSVP
jgi:hypothetical protein